MIRFLWAKKCSGTEIYRQLCDVYGTNKISRQAIGKWCILFENGRANIEGDYREGRPSTVTTNVNVERVKQLIETNRRVIVCEIADELGISYRGVHHIITDYLILKRRRPTYDSRMAVASWTEFFK
ncbi:Putative uncharacterized protein FLJ37770 [Habropoda laboriosa]|uniref:Mos1 transposase HTH domain-containing protein n=1 Tax=Habropoda laboriosa TaxID=597456 RepID=A0A0L7QZY5_9HYME|nr:Putative uncharacterized protein FLJ37770 [Habropoda laboriosa]